MNDSAIFSSLLIGGSESMRRLREEVAAVAPTKLSIVIEGDTGTGKENVARAVHVMSGRPGAFVPVNVCAIGEPLFESEMFGHERGAFTGAVASRSGRFVEADSGTLLLDELSGLGLGAQAKLLRALETAAVRPVGATRDRPVSTRFIAATNVPLSELVERDSIRTDLGFRLAQWRIRVPSLAERTEDVPLLAAAFAASGDGPPLTFSEAVFDELAQLHWPGNVRQLKSFVEVLRALRSAPLTRGVVREVWERIAWHPGVRPAAANEERSAVLELLQRFEGRKEAVADALGIHVSTLYRRLAKLGLSRPSDITRSVDWHRGASALLPP
jgi:DNA-binding NtrC family response regulator